MCHEEVKKFKTDTHPLVNEDDSVFLGVIWRIFEIHEGDDKARLP